MILELKVRKIGNSVGIVLPKEALAHLKVEEGDTLVLTESADRTVRIGPADAEFTKQMEVANKLIQRYRNALRELAK